MKARAITAITAVAAAGLAAACASKPGWEKDKTPAKMSAFCARSAAGALEGNWQLQRINGAAWSSAEAVTLTATPTTFGGEMACNAYGVGGEAGIGRYYEIRDKRLIVPAGVLQTKIACDRKKLEAFDEDYVAILEAKPYVVRDEDQLCLRTDDGRSLEFWRMAEPRAPAPALGPAITPDRR